MNWQHFQTYNEAATRAFEAMCNQLFELWTDREYKETKRSFVVVNGAGGDGGVESYVTLINGEEIGVQAKWFPDSITTSQFNQIKNSILTAIEVHPQLVKYIVCVPRDLSNVKKGKDGKLVKETEYSKWKQIVTDIKNSYPGLKMVLWGDHALECQLQYVEAAGIRRYWFEKEEIAKEVLQYSFDKQKNGWLDQRYIPVLHNQGTIHKELLSFLGNSEECRHLLTELEEVRKNYEMLMRQIDVLCEFLHEKNINNEKIDELGELRKRVSIQLVDLKKIKKAFRYENKLEQWNERVLTYGKLGDIMKWLEKKSHGEHYCHYGDVSVLLEKIWNVDMFQLLEKLKQRCNFEKIVVLGGQGTGKTHGIANLVETQLIQGYHIPVLIQAKSIAFHDEWKDMIIRVLGLSQKWSEDELWSALEAVSYRNEISAPMSDMKKGVRIVPKVVICIDGIDEIKPYDRWRERISQVDAITSRHRRIRFCFTGRPYAFDRERILLEKNLKKVTLYDDGDVPVEKIYDKYIRYYHVNDEGVKWLRHTISTPYALKLVCEIYEGKTIGQLGKADVTVTNLLKSKFKKLDQEFKTQEGVGENANDQIVKLVLFEINKIFEVQSEAERSQIKSVLRKLEIYQYLKETGIDNILTFLERHSFLQSYVKCSNSFFEEDKVIYSLGTQPVYDYLKALRLFERCKYSDDLELDVQVLENMGALQMYAVLVLDKYGKILWNNKSCQEYFDEEDLFTVVAFALVNVNENISSQYVQWIKKVMKINAFGLSLVVNKIVLPLARAEKHPLGSVLLDSYLAEFSKAAERDMIWSVPSGLKGNEDFIWIRYEDIAYANESYGLEDTDCFDGMPLVWVWGLTSVDNGQRTMVRQEIAKWGIAQPVEFYKLFEHFVNVNDIQAKTDIFAIAMAVTHVCRKNYVYLKLISKWIYHNIFVYGKIKNMHNAAIRYYARAIMECALSEGMITNKQIDKCRPPYRTNTSLLPFAVEATEGTRMAGYKTMDYDVARYVLCDPLDRMFLSNRNHKEDVEMLVKRYGREYGLPNLTLEQWVLGSAFGQVKAAGWREDVFYGIPNGGKPGERLGLDIAICRQFRAATHGSMSRIMTITEKYSWCAKMELLGYLADRLPFYDYENGDDYIKDYGQLEDYVNPYQELCQIDVDKDMKETDWILPEELAPSIVGCEYSKEGIQKWISESTIPSFEKWINIQDGEMTLYAAHFISNEAQGVKVMMWISSGLIHKGSISSLVKGLKDREFAIDIIKNTDRFAYPASECYISPLEVCWFDWKEEYDSGIEYGKNIFYKNVAKCTCDIQGKGETEYEIPSKKIRKMMGIVSGDGYHYYSNDGIEIASYREAGEHYDDSQYMLMANKEIFESRASELGLQPVWVIRVLKEISNKASERFDCFMDRDETYLVWKNSKCWKVKKIECED